MAMKSSSIVIIYCVLLVLLVFFFQNTGLGSSTASHASSLCINLNKRVPRRVLSIVSSQQYKAGSTQSPADQEVQKKAKSSTNGNQDDNNDDDDMIYHIDYRGVMTHHPAPTPKHS